MRISKKREAGEILGRGGISQRIINIANEIASGTYKEAIEKAGQIKVLVESSTFDGYWTEKATKGLYREERLLTALINNDISKEDLTTPTKEKQ